MSDYELAMLRLEAWKAIDGWGPVNETAPELIGRLPKPWGWTERMQRAGQLADWAARKDEKAPPA